MSTVVVKLIRLYQFFSKIILKHRALPIVFYSDCRFYPSCSEYTVGEIRRHGVRKGLLNGFIRILKCNPLL